MGWINGSPVNICYKYHHPKRNRAKECNSRVSLSDRYIKLVLQESNKVLLLRLQTVAVCS
jgi:hypothetical protein